MKKVIFGLVVLMFFSFSSSAQSFRVNGYTAYVFDDHVEAYDGIKYFNGEIKGGFRWGVGLEYMMHPAYGIELQYLRQDTKAPLTIYNGLIARNVELDAAINWLTIGGNRYFRKSGGKAEGFFGVSLGAAFVGAEDEDGNSDDVTKFAWGLKGGVTFWATERVGIKLQADLMSAVQGAGGGLYFGTGGLGAGVNTYSTMYQFGLGGGLTFALGDATGKKTDGKTIY